MDVTRNIDNYIIEVVDGRKVIHYNGFTWPNEGSIEHDGKVPGYLADEMTWCFIPVSEYRKGRLDEEMALVQQYQYPLDTREDVARYLKGAEHLPLREANEDTPCGEYWCYLEEE
jgi:hypothetical protein